MTSSPKTSSTVSVNWLNENLHRPELILLDASLPKPKSNPADNPLNGQKIGGARFFDIDHSFSDASSDLPHMMVSEEIFNQEAQKLGIRQDSLIIVYDNLGVYSSPRAWWMFRSMGHSNVFVLDGGLPAWAEAGFPIEPTGSQSYQAGNFYGTFDPGSFLDAHKVKAFIDDADSLILDARSSGRFEGTEPEPREGLRGGHIPNSLSLPFSRVIDGFRMKDTQELKQLFRNMNADDKSLTFTCGSGLTACIIALAADLAGYENLSVYDGSWSEWGLPSDLPVLTGK